MVKTAPRYISIEYMSTTIFITLIYACGKLLRREATQKSGIRFILDGEITLDEKQPERPYPKIKKTVNLMQCLKAVIEFPEVVFTRKIIINHGRMA